jgi:hypothetical protein
VWTTVGSPPATTIPSPLRPPAWQGIMWGIVPFGTSLVTILLAFLQRKKRGSLEASMENIASVGAGVCQATAAGEDQAEVPQLSPAE